MKFFDYKLSMEVGLKQDGNKIPATEVNKTLLMDELEQIEETLVYQVHLEIMKLMMEVRSK